VEPQPAPPPGPAVDAPVPALKLTPARPVPDPPIAMAASINKGSVNTAALKPALNSSPLQSPLAAGTVAIPVGAVSEKWPQQVLKWLPAKGADLEVPIAELQPAIQTGRAVFSWKQIRGWMRPAASGGAEHDSLLIELPLRDVVPLFMAAARPGAATARRQVAIEESIPDLFHGAEGLAEKDLGEISEPPPKVVESPRLPPSPAREATTPAELVQEVCQISGVCGALITPADGLLLAQQLPANVNSEALAAFVPQIFSRLSQSTIELKLGAPRQITASLDQFVLHLLKSGTAYFAVLTVAGGEAVSQARFTEIALKLKKISNSH
jgi:predicted regulator of Ras-like GTPase activity (Roadblock/LC7/MglB family)